MQSLMLRETVLLEDKIVLVQLIRRKVVNKKIEENKKLWNELTTIHLKGSNIYPIEEFKKGKNVLKEVELKEVGKVQGKELFHLQCHFGMDTLSWARLGAQVTGVDISEKAIHAARKLAEETNIKAEFILSDVLELEGALKKKFDIVFASYGVFYWIPDIKKWFQIASQYIKKDGFLYIVDGHPVGNWLSREGKECISNFEYSYFDRAVQRYESSQDYADESYEAKSTEYGWHYTVSDLINGAVNAGLVVNHFNEFSSFDIKYKNNKWVPLKDNKHPVLFSLKATKQ